MIQLLLALLLAAQTEASPALLARLRPLLKAENAYVAVYDRYKSGRPRRVVAATDSGIPGSEIEDRLLLVRLPDRDGGAGVLLDEMSILPAVSLELLRLADPVDISLVMQAPHNEVGGVYRIVNDRFHEIADAPAYPANTPDLDGDGIPEIVRVRPGGFGEDECGTLILYSLLRWDGTHYAEDDHVYPVILNTEGGGTAAEDSFTLPAGHRTSLELRVVRDKGITSVKVTLDGKPFPPGEVLSFQPGCHRIKLEVTGAAGARAFALVERR
jgi:hypothetical protein